MKIERAFPPKAGLACARAAAIGLALSCALAPAGAAAQATPMPSGETCTHYSDGAMSCDFTDGNRRVFSACEYAWDIEGLACAYDDDDADYDAETDRVRIPQLSLVQDLIDAARTELQTDLADGDGAIAAQIADLQAQIDALDGNLSDAELQELIDVPTARQAFLLGFSMIFLVWAMGLGLGFFRRILANLVPTQRAGGRR